MKGTGELVDRSPFQLSMFSTIPGQTFYCLNVFLHPVYKLEQIGVADLARFIPEHQGSY